MFDSLSHGRNNAFARLEMGCLKSYQELADKMDECAPCERRTAGSRTFGEDERACAVAACEPQFKSSIENQAISRAYRMGQTREVFVHRPLCTDTIDERIMQILANRQRIFDAFADRSVAAEQVEQTFSRETIGEIVRDELRKYAGAR